MKNKPFEIGLALPGTSSGGAYTAGVTDFILEALDEWQKIKDSNRSVHQDNYDKWDVPWHDVLITGLSGSSGGGTTCALLLNLLGRTITPVSAPPAQGTVIDNDLYNTWVEFIDLKRILDTSDLDKEKKVGSLLNTDVILAKTGGILLKSRFGNKQLRSYISAHLKAIITVTNLRGIPYYLQTKGIGANQILYKRHEDYLKFELSADNTHKYPDTYFIPYDTSLPAFNSSYNQLIAAGQATSALFPFFISQPVRQNDSMYRQRENAKDLGLPKGTDYDFLSIDGAFIISNPFELLRKDMLSAGEAQNPRSGDKVERAVIIVAPLQTAVTVEKEYDTKKNGIADVIPLTMNATRNQGLFDAEDIELALDESIYSRFIIAPVRYDQATDKPATPAITATLLANFSAFLSRDFRQHDYFLGRRNAQQFLRNHFAIPVEEIKKNPLFSHLNIEQNQERFRRGGFVFTDESDGIDYFNLIPLTGKAAEQLYNPAWPKGKFNQAEIDSQLSKRTGRIIDVFIESLKPGFLLRVVRFFLLKSVKNRASAFLHDLILRDLKKNGLG